MKKNENKAQISSCRIASPLGTMELSASEQELISVSFVEAEQQQESVSAHPVLIETARQLSEYFEGTRRTFQLNLHPQGSDFQQQVWHQLRQIPFGTTATYLQLAQRLGNVKSIRAAASANGKNPWAIIVPCHRVIGANGALTGYAGGLHRKQWLLQHEARLSGHPALF